MIGYKEDKKIMMEEIKVESTDILAIEGLVRGCKTRIILVYMDSNKLIQGTDYNGNKPTREAARDRSRHYH